MVTTNRLLKSFVTHALIILFGIVMIYPIVWLFFVAFKPSSEVLTSPMLLPTRFMPSNFVNGWKLVRPLQFGHFLMNSFILVSFCVVGSILISLFTGYGFARFGFSGKNVLFTVLFLTIMMPATTTMISKYVIFTKLGWLNTYLPFAVPAFLGVGVGGGFFIFLVCQFIKGIPRELDEAAKIDGCSSLGILLHLILPLSKSALFSVAIFAFLWNWDDFQNQLLYLSNIKTYTVPLALRSTIDVGGADNWGAIMAMSFVSMLPAIILFFSLQQYFVEGIASTGIKG